MSDRYLVLNLCDETGKTVGGFVLPDDDVRLLLSQRGRNGVVPYEFVGICDSDTLARAIGTIRRTRETVAVEQAEILRRLGRVGQECDDASHADDWTCRACRGEPPSGTCQHSDGLYCTRCRVVVKPVAS